MAYYDSQKMRTAAGNISAELTKYKASKEAIDQIIENLHNNFDDENSTNYCNKYKNEAKVAAENVEKLMNEFVKLLETSASNWDRLHSSAKNDIG